MQRKIGKQMEYLIWEYTCVLLILVLGIISTLALYNKINDAESSSRTTVNIIASHLNKQYLTIEDQKPVSDQYYLEICNEAIQFMDLQEDVTSIYAYQPINSEEKFYLMNIERNDDGKSYNVEDYIGLKEEFTYDLNPDEKRCYDTGELVDDSEIVLFNKYGSTISVVAPVYDRDNRLIAFVGLDYDISYFIDFLLESMFGVVFVLILVGYCMGRLELNYVNKSLVRQILSIEEAAMKFTMSAHDGNSSQYHLPVNDSENELNLLAKSMNTMMMDIDDYIINIQKITAEKERISVELDVATKIQASYLPNLFPPFPSHSEIDLYATMDPAKEVGGDFYDFFMLGEDKLVLVVADVSGKGVPAALFMMIGKTLIKNQAANTESPAEIMTAVNNQLSEHNDASMFITIWLGIVDLKTGVVKACNAGHNPPVIQRAGGKFEIYKDKHGLVAGIMPDIRYKEYEFHLNHGDCVFNCTDGVQEATNGSKELFENSRMLEALNRDPDADTTTLLGNVKVYIDEFVADAPQFDDITMLAFRYLGAGEGENKKI